MLSIDKLSKIDKHVKFFINRDEEDSDVITFQKTKDTKIFEKIYVNRIPTLKYLSKKYAHLYDGKEDMYGFLNVIFVNCVNGYQKERTKVVNGKTKLLKTQFNTYFYTSVLNRIVNIITSKNAQKRTPIAQIDNEGEVIQNNQTLSLDYEYYSKNEDNADLKKIVADDCMIGHFNPVDKMLLEETVNVLSDDDTIMKSFFTKISEGHSVSSIIRDLKTRRGSVGLSDKEIESIKHNIPSIMSIIANIEGNEFDLIDCNISNNKLTYVIELLKTSETDYILKNIRKIRNEKLRYLYCLGIEDNINEINV